MIETQLIGDEEQNIGLPPARFIHSPATLFFGLELFDEHRQRADVIALRRCFGDRFNGLSPSNSARVSA